MTLEKQLEQKEKELFILQCKDHYTNDDWETSDRLHTEIQELKKEIKNGRV